jgi:hypothetical protein
MAILLLAAGLAPSICLGQALVDNGPVSTLPVHAGAYIDSIKTAFFSTLDTARSDFDSVMSVSNRQFSSIESKLTGLKSRLDSVKIVHQIDSILHWKDKRLKRIATKSDSIQLAIKGKLDNLPLPPELREKANQVLNQMSALQAPLANDIQANIRTLGNLIPGVSENIQSIASLGSQLRGVGSLDDLDALGQIKIPSMPSLQQQAPDMSSVTKVGEINAENLTGAAQQQLSNSSLASAVETQIGKGAELTSLVSKAGDAEAMKQQLLHRYNNRRPITSKENWNSSTVRYLL